MSRIIKDREEKNRSTHRMVADGSSYAQASRSRASKSSAAASKSDISGMLCNISAGVSPLANDANGDINARDAIELCQKAYWNVASFRSTIDIMSEFSNAPLSFKSKNKTAVGFFDEWWKKIKGPKLGDQFFRELFRSSNIFLLRNESRDGDFKSKPGIKLPLRYILLNPADINCDSVASFADGSYKKVLNEFEVAVLKNSKDPKNIAIKESLPAQVQKDIKNGVISSIPLNPDEVISVFFKKQDYEAMAVPIFFPVLFDINLKLEFKKAEHIIARACEYMMLIIKLGDKELGVDPLVQDAVETLFQTGSVGRVFITDWSTQMDYLIPDLEKILGPSKYEAVNADISNGLMNIFFGEQKYAESMVKIRVFLERLKEARKVFLNEFLIPEMEIICEKMGFRECPVPEFEQFDMKDEVEYMKLYNRLAEMGQLTPEETITAYKTHTLPEPYDSIVSQGEYKKYKEDGLYAPAAGIKGEPGKPVGQPQNQKAGKKVTSVGQGSFSCQKLKDASISADQLIKKTISFYKNKFGITRVSKSHKAMANNIACSIMQNEAIGDWDSNIQEYSENPLKQGPAFEDVCELAAEHNLDFTSAALLFASKKEN